MCDVIACCNAIQRKSKLVSGAGQGSAHFEYHKTSSGSGTYSHLFDIVGVATGTVTDTSHEDWTSDKGYADSVVNHGWATVTSGSSLETSGSLRTATGGGSYSTPNSSGNITDNLRIQPLAERVVKPRLGFKVTGSRIVDLDGVCQHSD